ncbi:MAG TPA: type VI secretion system tip protein TssI/VgrG, partial [Gaiellaceae bacterium]|nr:type VI secretion system tip protein TssI/VgrG [Gaiellaceae bacterium]
MFANTQLLGVKSPLGDALSLNGFGGTEGLSQLFSLELDLIAGNDAPDVFKGLLGQPVSVQAGPRHFDGICSRISQGESSTGFTAYRAEVVPWLWLLTRNRNSRSFQNMSVPEIAERVAADSGRGLSLRLEASYERREYVVQHNESDFDFVSRLLEEEGIYFYFEQSSDGHQLVVGDGPAGHTALEPVRFDPDGELKRLRESIYSWEKTQELTPGKVTVRDHHFELPDNDLEGSALLQEAVAAGGVTHVLRTAAGDGLELYDYPGGYAERFDGIDPGGGEQPGELQKLFPAAARDAELRMQAEAAAALEIAGASNVRALAAGRIVTLIGSSRRFDGKYLVTRVTHRFDRHGDRVAYSNTFTCIPEGLPFRSPRKTRCPVAGVQTAVVVGPPGETVFADKYGRVKVRFHWDRDDDSSSTWVRVAHP